MKFKKLPIYAITTALMAAPTMGLAGGYWHDDDEVDLEEAYLYFELNDTDGDLGIHGKADGDAWKRMKVEGPEGRRERKILDIRARSGLRRQGLTELFFESAEPTFDELDPEVFFPRFPEGLYEWEGRTLDYKEIEGEVWLSHIIPAAPVVASVGEVDEEVGDNEENPGFEIDDEGEIGKACWEAVPNGNGGVAISWDAVETSHFDMWDVSPQPLLEGEDLRYGGDDQPDRKIPLGVTGTPEDVEYYEFVAEIDDTEYKSTAVVPPEVRSWTIPQEFIALAEADDEGVREIKFEIIVRVGTGDHLDEDGEPVDSTLGNQSAVEDCFEI